METLSERRLTALLMAATVLAGACGGGGSSAPPPANMTTTVAAVGGNGQTGVVGQVLADPIQVVVNEDGQPAPDVTVIFIIVLLLAPPTASPVDRSNCGLERERRVL